VEGKRGQMVNRVTRIGIAERVGEIEEARREEVRGVAKDQTTTKWQTVVGVPYAPSTR